MNKSILAACVFAAALLTALHPAPSGAQIISYVGGGTNWRTDGPYTVGSQFTVGASPITINALGVYDWRVAEGGDRDGFWNNMPVGLWDDSGNLLRSATVLRAAPAAGDTPNNTLNGTYQYVFVAPVTLAAGATYRIGAVVGYGYEWFTDNSTAKFTGSGVTIVQNVYNTGGTLTYPGSGGGGTIGRWGPANAMSLAAGTSTWTGGSATSDNWTDNANWGGADLKAGDNLVFAGGTRLAPNNNILANTGFSSVTFAPGAGPFTLGGNAVNLLGNVVNNSANTQTINLNLVLEGAGRTFDAAAGDLVVNGAVGQLYGAQGLTKTGAGTLILGAANTYSGGTTVSAGTLRLNNVAAAGSGAVTLGDAGTGANNVQLTLGAANIANNITVSNNGTGTATLYGNVQFSWHYGTIALNRATVLEIPNTGAGTDWWYGFGAGGIGGTGPLVIKGGAGGASAADAGNRIMLGGTNTYSGGTTVESGKLQLGSVAAAGTGTITLGNANTGSAVTQLRVGADIANNILISSSAPGSASSIATYNGLQVLSGGLQIDRPVTLQGAGDRLTWSGAGAVWSGAGDITISGGRVTHDTAANTWTGSMTINAGSTFQPGSASTLTAANSVTTNGTLQLNNVPQTINGLSGSGIVQNVVGANTLTVGAGGATTTFSGVIQNGSGAMSLVKAGGGTLILTGANTYTGGTTINAGVVDVGNANAFGTGPLTLNASGTVITGSAFNLVAAANAHSTGTDLVVNGNASFANNMTITGGTNSTRGLSIGGAGTLTYSGVVTPYNGPMGLKNTATLKLASGSSISLTGTLGNQIIFADPGTALVLDGGSFSSTGNNGPSAGYLGNLTVNSGSFFAQSNENNAGRYYSVVLLNTNSSLSLNGGTTSVQAITTQATGANMSTIRFNGGTLRVVAQPPVSAAGNFIAANANLTALVQAGGAVLDTDGNNATIAQSLLHDAALGATPDGGLTKLGAGTLILSGANTYTGGTTVSRGTVQFNNTNAAGTGTITLGDAATGANEVRINMPSNTAWPPTVFLNNNINVSSLAGGRAVLAGVGGAYAALYRGTITLQNKDLVIRNEINGDRTGIEGKITGTGNVTIEGTGGRVNWDNAGNDFLGSLTITPGAMLQVNGTVIPDTSDVAVNGTMRFYSTGDTINGLSGNGLIDVWPGSGWNATLTVGQNNGGGTFTGAMQNGGGTMALRKVGAGAQELTGASTYSGGTTVTDGTLLVNNTAGSATGSGPVRVNKGTLGGNGAMSGPVTVGDGSPVDDIDSYLAPGNSPGILSTGSLTMNSDAMLLAELWGPIAGDPINGYDQVNVTGGVTLNGPSLDLDLQFAPALGDQFVLIQNDASDAVSGTFVTPEGPLAEGSIVRDVFNGYSYPFSLSYMGGTGNDVVLTAVPEPSTLLLAALALAGLLAWRRFRRRV